MIQVILALGIGVLAGYFNLFKSAGRYIAGPVSTAGVVLLLFFMGAKIGADREIMNNLGIMGLEALVYAVTAIMGSLLMVWAWQFLEQRKTEGQKEGEGV
ncbi:MAG TPA: lysine exporter LysO family protein [Firmicutes bacterium]|nr:lysine exporter LysO family protein [Bacillota bacterium]